MASTHDSQVYQLKNGRWAYRFSMYFASRIPGEACFEKILHEIEAIEAKD